MVDAAHRPIEVCLQQTSTESLPAPGRPISKTVPYIAADPSNLDRVYVFYQDLARSDPSQSDMNVYCVRLDNHGSGAWTAEPAVRVNDDAVVMAPFPDQFTPSAVVDTLGRVHVIFYDNRLACTGSCDSIMYDEFYAVSRDHGATFANYNLRDAATQPTFPVNCIGGGFDPHEYNGIAFYDTPTATELWMTYQGVISESGASHTAILLSTLSLRRR